jgi:GT2 family glycosyltransferase
MSHGDEADQCVSRIGIGIATSGRAAVLRQVLADIALQTRLPDRVIVCQGIGAGVAEDLGTVVCAGQEIISAPLGLPSQRNAILDATADLDVLLFIDDDFLMESRYLEAVIAALRLNASLVATTGTLIHDDVKGPGLSVEAGRTLIARDNEGADTRVNLAWRPAPHAYGCNMALRMSTVRAHGLRFDERLPLYAWSEDMDFTHRIARHGTIGKLDGARGVHLGVKQGRSSGLRLGYSQVANPIYLLQKGSYSAGRAGRSVCRNLAANLTRALWSEPYIDRRGRLAGNVLAFADWCIGRMRPERILDL